MGQRRRASELDMGVRVPILRLHAALPAPPD